MKIRVLITHMHYIADCWDFFPECHIVHRSLRILQGRLRNANNNNNNNIYNTLRLHLGACALYGLVHKEHRNAHNKKIGEKHGSGILILRLIDYL